MSSRPSSIEIARNFIDRRLLWVLLMGCSSGFPWVLIGSNMSGWLKDVGLTRAAIGYFGSIFTVYAFNFLWAPLVDRVSLPLIGKLLGQRRSWIFLMQFFMMMGTLAIAGMNPAANIKLTSLIALFIALSSATQDIAIDAFRIDSFSMEEKEKMPAASAMAVIGWWTGYSLPGYLAFINADTIGWNGVYYGMAAIIGFLMVCTLIVREPVTAREQIQKAAEKRFSKNSKGLLGEIWVWLVVSVYEPFAEYFRRNGGRVAITILLFVFLFKIGEAFLGRMSIPFYKEIGFSNEQIGYYSKLIGWGVTIVFTVIGSIINVRFGIVKGLLIGGIAMAGSNLMFAWLASSGPNEHIFMAAIIVDNFTSAFATIAFVSFLTFLTGRGFSATQYALLASIGNFGRTSLASLSGLVVDWLNGSWPLFFILTTVMVVPSLLLLLSMRSHFRKLHEME